MCIRDRTEDLAQPIAAYSHGMKQKLAIISAWLHRPRPVSYTHLDVYKRQVKIPDEDVRPALMLMVMIYQKSDEINREISVSYTHLDVYKRQLYRLYKSSPKAHGMSRTA